MKTKILPFTDKHENTYLLQAAQPKTATERMTALDRLKFAVKQGTFIVTETSYPLQQSFIFINAQEKYEEVSTEWNNNLAFEILNITRDEFMAMAQKADDDLKTRECVAEEFNKCLIIHPEFMTTHQVFIDSQYYQSNFEKIFNSIQNDLINPANKKLSAGDLVTLLRTKTGITRSNQDQHLEKLNGAQNILNKKSKAALEFCQSPAGYKHYLNLISSNKLPIGINLMQLIARIKKIPLTLWKIESNNKISALKSNISYEPNQDKVINLLMTDHFKFFLLLPARTSTDPLKVLTLTKSFDYKPEKNKYGHDLLLRAVRSVAADLLVPYILNDLDFKEGINNLNFCGNTALHRAIKYFAEFRSKLIAEFNQCDIDYDHVIKTVFTSLLEAGANLELKNNEKMSPLDRARNYNSSYHINLDIWILETQKSFMSSRSAKRNGVSEDNILPDTLHDLPNNNPSSTKKRKVSNSRADQNTSPPISEDIIQVLDDLMEEVDMSSSILSMNNR